MSDKKKSLKRNLIEWGIIFGIFGILFATGLHTEVIGRLQQVILWTGLRQPDITIPEEEQTEANYNMLLSDFDGNTVALSQFQDDVIFINFWASWCPPCVAEMPSIQNLYDFIADNEHIKFALISLDENPEDAQQFIERRGFDMPVYFLASGVPDSFYSQTVPTTFVVSADGYIVARKKGLAKYNTKKFRNFLISHAEQAKTQSTRSE